MFENLSLPHILMVLMIVMLLFGAKRIPEIAGSMGKGIKEFKKNVNDATRDEPSSLTRGGSGAGLRSTQADLEEERQAGPKRLS
ncbi:MAG TPA: twin-arginine translocase TatA/TatE family subunit [Gemmatimonadaceae bacterium]|jgi:sec-independent protein translocase protein TatA